MAIDRFYATGKRKSAVARVWLTPGIGKVIVNQLDAEAYFGGTFKTPKIEKPFKVTDTSENTTSRHPQGWWQVGPGRGVGPWNLQGPARYRFREQDPVEAFRTPHPRSASQGT